MIQPGSCEERLFRLPKRTWELLLFPLNLDYWTLSVASSVVSVNGEKSVSRSWTNLIVEDRLLDIFEKPECIFTGLDVVSRQKRPRLLGKQPQLFLDGIELAKGK